MSTLLAESEALQRQPPSSFTSRYYSRKEESERCLAMAAGVGLTVLGLASRSVAGTLLAMTGGYIAYQAADCSHRWSEPNMQPIDAPQPRPYVEDHIDQAIADSFPASDPPSY